MAVRRCIYFYYINSTQSCWIIQSVKCIYYGCRISGLDDMAYSSFNTIYIISFVRYYQERNYSTILFKSRNVLIGFQILPLLLPCSMIPSGTLRKHMEPLHFTITNNVYFPEVNLTLSILYQWTRNIDHIIFSEDFEHGENYSAQVLRKKINILGIIFISI